MAVRRAAGEVAGEEALLEEVRGAEVSVAAAEEVRKTLHQIWALAIPHKRTDQMINELCLNYRRQ